ncbi:MAG: hypothetical protein CL764_01695 [Chloroflexi bacterium]|nr:hypothetical protein [Chloroflexota bacterium]|tara:strand:+ start:3457 stop:3864 length:408 start_codon:yes stop_codon:yes gene_type:complete
MNFIFGKIHENIGMNVKLARMMCRSQDYLLAISWNLKSVIIVRENSLLNHLIKIYGEWADYPIGARNVFQQIIKVTHYRIKKMTLKIVELRDAVPVKKLNLFLGLVKIKTTKMVLVDLVMTVLISGNEVLRILIL